MVGIMLVLSATYDINSSKDREKAFDIGNKVSYGSFVITVLNIFIATFGKYDSSVMPDNMFNNATSGS